jgi:protein-tyrosine phosphatase
VQKTYNVRDIGVYRRRDGSPLQQGVFYRADNLGRLDMHGVRALRDYGVRTVVDLRTADEIREFPNPYAADASIRYHAVDMVGDSHDIISRGDTIQSTERERRLANGMFADPAGRIAAIYTTILDHQQDKVRAIFAALAAESDGAALFHCVAGQDRTGIVAALILSIADVPEETIIADYAATAHYNVERFIAENHAEQWNIPVETAAQYRSQFCPAGAMEATLAHIEAEYGGAASYLRAAGVSAGQIEAISMRLG